MQRAALARGRAPALGDPNPVGGGRQFFPHGIPPHRVDPISLAPVSASSKVSPGIGPRGTENLPAFGILSCEYKNSIRIPAVLSADQAGEGPSRGGFFALPWRAARDKEGDFDER
jgi:hypothetical protein